MRFTLRRMRRMEGLLCHAIRVLDTSPSSKARPFDPALSGDAISIEALRETPYRQRFAGPPKIGVEPTLIEMLPQCSGVIRDGEGLRLGKCTGRFRKSDRAILSGDDRGDFGGDPVPDGVTFVMDPNRRTYDVVRGVVDACKRLPGTAQFPLKTLAEVEALQDELRARLSR